MASAKSYIIKVNSSSLNKSWNLAFVHKTPLKGLAKILSFYLMQIFASLKS